MKRKICLFLQVLIHFRAKQKKSIVSKARDKSRKMSRKVCLSLKSQSSLDNTSNKTVSLEWKFLWTPWFWSLNECILRKGWNSKTKTFSNSFEKGRRLVVCQYVESFPIASVLEAVETTPCLKSLTNETISKVHLIIPNLPWGWKEASSKKDGQAGMQHIPRTLWEANLLC